MLLCAQANITEHSATLASFSEANVRDKFKAKAKGNVDALLGDNDKVTARFFQQSVMLIAVVAFTISIRVKIEPPSCHTMFLPNQVRIKVTNSFSFIVEQLVCFYWVQVMPTIERPSWH